MLFKRNVDMCSATTASVFLSHPPDTGDTLKNGLSHPPDPARGAEVTAAVRDRKIREAIWREARRVKRRLYFDLPRLYLLKLVLQLRCFRLNARYYLRRKFAQSFLRRHITLPRWI